MAPRRPFKFFQQGMLVHWLRLNVVFRLRGHRDFENFRQRFRIGQEARQNKAPQLCGCQPEQFKRKRCLKVMPGRQGSQQFFVVLTQYQKRLETIVGDFSFHVAHQSENNRRVARLDQRVTD